MRVWVACARRGWGPDVESVTRLLRLVLAIAALACVMAPPALAADPPADDCAGGVPDNPAGSATVWSEPQCLSPSQDNGEVPQVAIADDGSAVAVWRYQDPRQNGKEVVQFSTRKRGENFVPAPSPPGPGDPADPNFDSKLDATFLSDKTHDVGTHIRLDMNKAGDAVVVWEEKEANGKIGIHSAYKPHDGDFGPDQVVQRDTGDPTFASSFVEPEVGIDGQGNATVIYHPPPAAFGVDPNKGSIYEAKSRSAASGVWDTDGQALIPHEQGDETNPIKYTETHASLSVNEAGDRFASFGSREFGGNTDGRQKLEVAQKESTDAAWSERGSSDTPSNTPDEEITATHIQLLEQTDQPTGNVFWSEGNSLRTEGAKLNPPYDGPTNGSGFAASLIASTTKALVLWSDGHDLRATSANPFNDPFSAPDGDPVPGAGNERTRPALAAYGDDSAVAVYQDKDANDDEVVQAALRPKGGTTNFDAPVTLSERTGGSLENDGSGGDFSPKTETGPKVAANASGEAVAAWARFDGANTAVQVSLLTPRNDPAIPPPPPPPPRPKPAVLSPIQLARPIARDQATVLIAKVPDGVTELRWRFESKDEPPIEGKIEGGHLQDTVRLRLPDSTFRANLHTEGSDGPHDYARTFASLSPSSSANTKEVLAGLKATGTPPVFAVGDQATLTSAASQAHSRAAGGACSPTTIWSGQQKMSGCFKPIEQLGDIPNPEKGALHEVADQLKLDETKKDLMNKATQLTDGYVAQGKALLNDEFPVTPSQAASIVSIPQAKSLISAKAQLPVGSATYDPKNGFNLKVDPKKIKIPLGSLPKPPKLPSIGGLEVVGDFDVDLEKREAKIKASVLLPKELTKAGVRISNEVRLTATADRIIVDGARVGPADVDIGALKVTDFKIEYKREGDEWDGQARACIIKAACLDMAPPNGHITIQNGRVTFAGASIIFPPPGIPLFTGVNLDRVGFGLGFDPTRIIGSGRLAVAQLIAVDGRLVTAFPSSRTPFILRRDEVGDDFPANLYGASFSRPTIGLSGGVLLKVPELGDIKFGSGYLLYEYPGYIAVGGGFDLNLLEIVQLRGSVAGEFDLDRELFNIHGNVQACLFGSDDICGGATANISHGPNKAGGAGACLQLGPLSVGGGVQWAHLSDPFIWPIDGCKWSPFKLDVRPSSAVAATSMDVKAGAPSPVLKLLGKGGAPRVRVRGPGGQQLDGVSPKNLDTSPGEKIRIMRFDGNKYAGPFTVVGLQNAQPGHYTIETLPGSPPINGTARATDQPDAKVTGRVTGKGRRRVLRYDVRKRAAQTVTFQEVDTGGAAKTIGKVKGGGRGRFAFKASPGGGVRRVVAQFTLAGLPAERREVATFKPLTMHLARPKHVRVRHRGSRLAVSWRKVPGASRYEVAAAMASRRMVFAATAKRGVVVKGVPAWASGRVTVRAVDDVRQSDPSAGRRFRAVGLRPSPFRLLFSCRVGAKKIACMPPQSSCLSGRLAVAGRRIGPARLGADYLALARRYPPEALHSGAFSLCVHGGGHVLAGSRSGRIDLIATTARGHSTRQTGPGRRSRGTLPGARRFAPGILVGHRVGNGRVLYGVRGRRVRFLAVVTLRQLKHPHAVSRRLRSLGLR